MAPLLVKRAFLDTMRLLVTNPKFLWSRIAIVLITGWLHTMRGRDYVLPPTTQHNTPTPTFLPYVSPPPALRTPLVLLIRPGTPAWPGRWVT